MGTSEGTGRGNSTSAWVLGKELQSAAQEKHHSSMKSCDQVWKERQVKVGWSQIIKSVKHHAVEFAYSMKSHQRHFTSE